MANDAYVSLIGFVATQPKTGMTKGGTRSLSMRVGWTPRTIDRATGQWSDLPSSFVTVQCYRKVAEHAAVCLRRGDPIVVRGTMRVREYVDQNGQRRSSVEVQADSIGHDMSRGITTFSKLPARAELTADEYEQSLAAADRIPLPGDLGQAASNGGQELDHEAGEDAELTGDSEVDHSAEPDPDLAAGDPELAAGGEFDESAVREMMAGTDDALDSIGAKA